MFVVEPQLIPVNYKRQELRLKVEKKQQQKQYEAIQIYCSYIQKVLMKMLDLKKKFNQITIHFQVKVRRHTNLRHNLFFFCEFMW